MKQAVVQGKGWGGAPGGWGVPCVTGSVTGLPETPALTSTRARIPLRGHSWAATGDPDGLPDVSGELPEAFSIVSGSS